MSVDISNAIMHRATPMLYQSMPKDDNTRPDESDSVVPLSTDGTYPDDFPGAAGYEWEHTEVKNPAYGYMAPLAPEYGSVGVDSFQRVQYDVGGEQGLRDNVPYTIGPVTGGGVSLGESWMDGRTVRIRRPAETGTGPVGQSDYASMLQYGLMMSEVQMAFDAASRATIAVSV
jgi:hypothetical protein